MRSRLAGFVPSFKSADVDRRIDFSSMNPISRFATAAAAFALADAGLRITPRTAEDFGIAMGVCNCSSEMEHMDSVFSTENHAADITCFSNIVANATAGWVSNALCIKGTNTTLAPGPHAGLQSLAYAYDFLSDNRVKAMLIGAADEVYAQTYFNYDLMRFLFTGDDEINYRIRLNSARQKVLGEGAAVLLAETLDAAEERNASILAEIVSYGMAMDAGEFSKQNLGTEGLAHACETAIARADISSESIGLIVWAPQGNIQDRKVLDTLQVLFNDRWTQIPLAATTFNTGYSESASILVGLAAALHTLRTDSSLWPQMTGIKDIDARRCSRQPEYILALASTDIGYNFAAVLRNGSMV
jgi:3-oxoacyl-[acyl-carrier-protein] synthase II